LIFLKKKGTGQLISPFFIDKNQELEYKSKTCWVYSIRSYIRRSKTKKYNLMSFLRQSIGIHVQREELHLRHAFLKEDKQIEMKSSKKLPNTPKEYWEAHMWIENQLGKHPEVPLLVVLEAGGMYHQPVIQFLNEKGYSLYVILPEKPEAEGQQAIPKSKAGGYKVSELVEMGLTGKLCKWEVQDSSMRKLRELSFELIQRKKDVTRASKRLKVKEGSREPNANIIRRLKSYIQLLDKQVVEINEDLRKLIDQDKQLNEPIDRISKTRGLDRVTLSTLISESDGYVLI